MGFRKEPYGHFIVKKHSKHTFRLIEEKWTPKRTTVTIPRESYPALGFNYNMSLEEAKLRASQINKQNLIESKKIIQAAKRLEDEKEINSAYLPEYLTASFESELQDEYEDNPDRLETISLKDLWLRH